jgi:hypothetical protein
MPHSINDSLGSALMNGSQSDFERAMERVCRRRAGAPRLAASARASGEGREKEREKERERAEKTLTALSKK